MRTEQHRDAMEPHRPAHAALGLAFVVALLAACSGPPPSAATPSGPRPLSVVTTSTVLADLVQHTGGDRVTAHSLVPAGVDVHTYQATAADLRIAAGADLFVMNGLGLDDWLAKTVETSDSRAPVVRLGEDATVIALLPGETPDTRNPHLWMDVSAALLYVTRIDAAVRAADPVHAADLGASAAAYAGELRDLDAWVRGQVDSVPIANRRIVTFHDAMPYYARAYGLTIVGVAVEAPGQDPSAGEIAALVEAIRTQDVRAIFAESQFPTALIDQIAVETGARVVATLYDDSLGNEPVTSYEGLMRWDTEQIVEALR